MRGATVLTILSALPGAGMAADGAAFHGIWGDDRACARAPLVEGGTRRASPFEIGPDWLRHGEVWCALRWFPTQTRGDGLFAGALARCGEDAVVEYSLGFHRTGEKNGGDLTIIWGDYYRNESLHRCTDDVKIGE